jgi:receptor-type tyrosine-protein phosphatase beta
VPLLQSEIVVVNDQQITDALTLRYTKTPKSVSRFDTYRFQLSDPNIPIKEKAANDTETKVTFTDLIPGRLYNITVWTVSDGVESLPLQRQDRLCKCSVLCRVQHWLILFLRSETDHLDQCLENH